MDGRASVSDRQQRRVSLRFAVVHAYTLSFYLPTLPTITTLCNSHTFSSQMDCSSNDRYDDLAFPLYYRFIISRQAHLDAFLPHQEHIVDLGHGFQITLLPYHNDLDFGVTPLYNSNATSSTTSDPDSTLATTYTALSSTNTYNTELGSGQHKNVPKEILLLPDTTRETLYSFSTEATSGSDNGTGEGDYHTTAAAVEVTLTLNRHDNYAKETAGMIRAIHLFEIDHDGDQLCLSKAIDGGDLIRDGVSSKGILSNYNRVRERTQERNYSSYFFFF